MDNKLHDLPIRIFLGRLSNVSKSDAKSYCKGLINKYFDDKENTYFSIKKSQNHIYYEIQEGGNRKSFLPAIVKFIEDSEQSELIIPAGTNNTKIKKIENSVIFEMLTEDDEQNLEKDEYLHKTKRSGSLTPFESDKRNLLAFSLSYIGLGFILLITSYYLYFTKPTISVDNQIDFNFRSFQDSLNRMERINKNEFVSKLFFEKNQWNIEILSKGNIRGTDNIESNNNDKVSNIFQMRGMPIYEPQDTGLPLPSKIEEDRG
jgi:hypothetical protein